MASRSRPAQTGRTYGCKRQPARHFRKLCQTGPSTYGNPRRFNQLGKRARLAAFVGAVRGRVAAGRVGRLPSAAATGSGALSRSLRRREIASHRKALGCPLGAAAFHVGDPCRGLGISRYTCFQCFSRQPDTLSSGHDCALASSANHRSSRGTATRPPSAHRRRSDRFGPSHAHRRGGGAFGEPPPRGCGTDLLGFIKGVMGHGRLRGLRELNGQGYGRVQASHASTFSRLGTPPAWTTLPSTTTPGVDMTP